MRYLSKPRFNCLCSRRSLLFFLLLTGIAARAEPADQDLTALSLEELMKVKVVSASRHAEDARVAPSAVTVITSEEISRYGWRTLGRDSQ